MSKRKAELAITDAELAIIAGIKKNGGHRLLKPGEPAKRLRALVRKGALDEIPGLLDGCPQGFKIKG